MQSPYPSRPRLRAWPLLALAVLLGALMALPYPGEETSPEAAAVVARLLSQDAEHAASAVRVLSDLGRSGLEPMFQALVQERVSAAEGRELPLSDSQRALLRRALGATEAGLLRAYLANALERDPPARAFEEALLIFAARARPQDLRFLLDTTVHGLEHGCDPAPLGAACEEAFGSVLARLPQAWVDFPGIWRAAPAALQPALIRAVGRSGNPAGLLFLAGLLGKTDEQDGILLDTMIELADAAEPPASDEVCEPLRRLLEWGSVPRVQLATILLGKLGDEEAIPALIEALESPSRGIQNQAGRALEAITGLAFRNEPRRWRAWYDEEVAWFDQHGDAALEALHSNEKSQVFEAVRQLARRRLHRQELAEELATLLGHEAPTVRRSIPGALAQIGSRVAVPMLVDALEDEDELVAQAAWTALVGLTGLKLPQEPEAWRAAVHGGR